MSDHQWFYSDAQQQQQGPVSLQQIQQMAASGQIQPNTLVWNESMVEWTPAHRVQGIFNGTPSSPSSTNPYATPASNNQPYAAPAGGHYPVPQVKKCSFPLFLITYLLGIIIMVAAVVPIFIKVLEATSVIQEVSMNPQDSANAQEEMERRLETKMEEIFTPDDLMKIGLTIMAGLFFSIFSWVIACIYIYRSWHILQPGGARTTPGKAVGFLFIPLFNFYWVFVSYYGWSQDWNRIQGSSPNLTEFPRASEGLFLTLCICFAASIVPLLGYLAILVTWILFPITIAKMCQVVNRAAQAQTA